MMQTLIAVIKLSKFRLKIKLHLVQCGSVNREQFIIQKISIYQHKRRKDTNKNKHHFVRLKKIQCTAYIPLLNNNNKLTVNSQNLIFFSKCAVVHSSIVQ